MSREILFKAKRIDWKDLPKEQWWIKGDVQHTTDKNIILIVVDDYKAYPCDSSTLCQYTGSTDKHNNKIWENDIARDKSGDIFYVYWSEERLNYSVKCIKSKFSIFIHQKWNLGELLKLQTNIEVCGNIFDNAELLNENE